MRFVNRKSVDVPPSLLALTGATADERTDAIQYYGATPSPKKAFEFAQYKNPDVVEALEKLFRGKCAYCESRYGATQPADIEHFRPKGCVAGEKHTGYWWLALEWENLLPSCIGCNRLRKQYIVDVGEDGQVEISKEKEAAGKKDAFPIRGKVRACKPADSLDAEDALLIDPTARDPSNHFQWVLADLAFPVVVPKVAGGVKDPMAEASIEVYGLNRLGLVEERGTVVQELASQFEDLREDVRIAASEPPGATRDRLVAQIGVRMEKLKAKGAASSRYSAAAIAYVDAAEAELKLELTKLLNPTPVAALPAAAQA